MRRARRLLRRWRLARLLQDPFLVYTATLAPIGIFIALLSAEPDLATVAILSPIAVGVQGLLGAVPAQRRPMTPQGWSLLRLAVSLLYVAGLAELVGGSAHPMLSLFIPVVVAAAVLGTSHAVVVGLVAALAYLAPELANPGSQSGVALRGLTHAGVSMLLVVGTRRLVTAVERTTAQLRSAMVSERRRSRQIAGMEAVSRLLVSGGLTAEMLDGALGILLDQFHYRYVAIYLLDGDQLRLGGQRGYDHPRDSFDGSEGIVGRVMRGQKPVFVPDVRLDPDYVALRVDVISEICAPLIYDGQFLGVLNVESEQPLDHTDRDLVATLAGRIATVVALSRDRQALAERAAVFRSLNEFTNAVSGELDLDRLGAAIVEAAGRVIPADIVTLTVLERETGRYLLRAATDPDPAVLGREILPGEGLAGRAVRDRAIVVDDGDARAQIPVALRDSPQPEAILGVGVPLLRDGVVVGALSIARRDRSKLFRPTEHEALELLAGHAALAISNAFLHMEVRQLATRDSLTGLYNRRYFDEGLQRIMAAWRRSLPGDRKPVAAIMFDLDRFGDFNKRHGHQVGDEVLRAFAGVLHSRFRDSDLVARFGGEEFVVILEGATRGVAVTIAEEVRKMLAERPVLDDSGARLQVTVSAGCAEVEEAEPTAEQLLRTADVALFMAKRAGRNRVVAA